MDEVVLRLRVEGEALREVEKAGVDLLEIPCVVEVDEVRFDLRLRRDRSDVGDHEAGEIGMLRTVQKHEAIALIERALRLA